MDWFHLQSSIPRLLPRLVRAVSAAVQPVPDMGNGAPGRKAHGGGKGRKNKDHRLHTLQRTIHKNRWDDICATELKVENYDRVVAEKTKLDPDLPGLGQYYCVACRRVLPCTLSCTLPCALPCTLPALSLCCLCSLALLCMLSRSRSRGTCPATRRRRRPTC